VKVPREAHLHTFSTLPVVRLGPCGIGLSEHNSAENDVVGAEYLEASVAIAGLVETNAADVFGFEMHVGASLFTDREPFSSS